MSLINAVAAIAVPNPSSGQLRGEVGQLLFHRLMYTTSPKLLGKIKPLHDLIHKEFVEKVLKREAIGGAPHAVTDEEMDEQLEAVPAASMYNRLWGYIEEGRSPSWCTQQCRVGIPLTPPRVVPFHSEPNANISTLLTRLAFCCRSKMASHRNHMYPNRSGFSTIEQSASFDCFDCHMLPQGSCR